jgi:hypothetical protein
MITYTTVKIAWRPKYATIWGQYRFSEARSHAIDYAFRGFFRLSMITYTNLCITCIDFFLLWIVRMLYKLIVFYFDIAVPDLRKALKNRENIEGKAA